MTPEEYAKHKLAYINARYGTNHGDDYLAVLVQECQAQEDFMEATDKMGKGKECVWIETTIYCGGENYDIGYKCSGCRKVQMLDHKECLFCGAKMVNGKDICLESTQAMGTTYYELIKQEIEHMGNDNII